MADIPKGLGNIDGLFKRWRQAEQNHNLWRSIHQEAYDFAAPQRETFRLWSPGQRKNRHIYDSTAVDGLEIFSNRIQSAIVPPWQRWVDLAAGEYIPKEDRAQLDKDLEYDTEKLFSEINDSNFSTEIAPAFVDLGIGTGAIEVDEGQFNADSVLTIANIPLSELYPEKPIKGIIENVWRQMDIEVGLIQETWPDAELTAELKSMKERNPHQEVKVLNAMLKNLEDRLYYQIVIHKSSKKILFTQSFKTKRIIVFRWHVVPGETFGRGPIIQKIADIRTVNKVKQFILDNAAIQISGVYTGVSDGIFNPYTVRITPGGIIPVRSNNASNPSLKDLPRAGDLGLGEILLEQLQNGIKKALFSEPFGEVTDPVKSATEQLLRKQKDLEERGASIGRLRTELIKPFITACVDILRNRGILDANIVLNNKTIRLKHVGPLSKAESMEGFQNSQLWYNNVSTLPPSISAGSAKLEELPRYWAEKLGVPLELVRTPAERKELGRAVVDAAQNAQNITGGGMTDGGE